MRELPLLVALSLLFLAQMREIATTSGTFAALIRLHFLVEIA